MTDSEILWIRDEMLPSQGEAFDALAFGRSVALQAAAQASAADSAENAELKEAYALLFKAHATERARLEDPSSMDCASCEYVAPTRHEQCKGCERTVTVHTNYKRASWA